MDYEDDKGKREFSGNTITIVSGVIALIIISAVVSAYPNGMGVSGTHDVVYNGSEDIVMSGKIGIKGSIDGIAASNVSGGLFSGAGEIVVSDGSSVKTFFNENIIISGGNSELNLTAYIDEEFGCAVVLFNTSNETSLGIITREAMNFSCTGDAVLVVKNSNVSVGNGTWDGSGDFVVTLKGGFHASMNAKILGISADGALNLSVEKGRAFDDKILDAFDIGLPPLPFDFNGFFAVSKGGLSVDGNPVTIKNFSFLRGAGTAAVSGNNMHIEMKATLIIIDGDFYSTERGTILWFIPDRIIGFWPIAIAIWVVAYLVKKRYMSKVEDYDKGLSGTSMVIHALGLVISFYLWDQEIRYMFGGSILSAVAESLKDGFSLGQWVVAPFEIVPFLAVMVFIALPVSIILSSIFGLIGFERLGKGVGKATGLLLLFFAGAVYISFFLNITLAPLIKGFMGF